MPTYIMTAEVEAMQFLPDKDQIPKGVISDGPRDPRNDPRSAWIVKNSYGAGYIQSGDYVVTLPNGEKVVQPKEIFEKQYKLKEGQAAGA